MPGSEFCAADVDRVPLEKIRDVVAALAEAIGLRLEQREQFYGETEFRFVKKHRTLTEDELLVALNSPPSL